MINAGIISGTVSTPDPYFANVVSLLHSDGSNGSTTFTDQITRTWTRQGTDAVISTASSKFGGASLFVTAITGASSNSNIQAAHETAFDLPGEFTIEWWQNLSTFNDIQVAFHRGTAAGGLVVQTTLTENARYQVFVSGGLIMTEPVPSPTLGVWYHMALVRHSGTMYLYRHGVSVASAANATSINSNEPFCWGGYPNGLYSLGGYLDDKRITKGVARYPSGTTFTPPTRAFPNY